MSVKAIIVVHIYGRQVNMDLVHAFAKKHGLFVIEDLAEAHGVKPHPETHAVCHSFYRNKIIAGEEGGAVWFRDPKHARLARSLRSLGFTEAHDFDHVPRGHNYRLANSLAVKVLQSLSYYEFNAAKRREIECWYDMLCPAEWRMPPRDAVWVYDVRIPKLAEPAYGIAYEPWTLQDEVVAELNKVGIAARHGFKPMHSQTEYAAEGMKAAQRMDRPFNSTIASREVIYLPVRPGETTWEDVKRAFEVIGEAL